MWQFAALQHSQSDTLFSMSISVWILEDQLLRTHPAVTKALTIATSAEINIVMIESRKAQQRLPYHRKRLALIMSAGRHYAEHLKAQGFTVDYRSAADVASGLRAHCEKYQPSHLLTMAASHYGLRQWQQHVAAEHLALPVEVLANAQFLTSEFDPYPKPEPDKRYLMEYFYRKMRKHFGLLIEPDGSPTGGSWNYDKLNREKLPKGHACPLPPTFEQDSITKQVILEVSQIETAVGSAKDFSLAVTHQQAQAAFDDFLEHRLDLFGPYEDAMTTDEDTLYHSVMSPYMNLGLLEPLSMVEAAIRRYHAGNARINSVEGFVRQIVGWREFMWWQYWRQMPGMREHNHWQATLPVPEFFWSGDTDMNCLKTVIKRVLRTSFNHHIERLMILCNFCVLAGIDPAEVNDWFMSLYIDAYDWVMYPNVIGMGLNADGGLTATKPYISSANYINKMSDFCGTCRYKPKQRHGQDACPFNLLYWNFLVKHESELRANPRMGPNVLALRHLDAEERAIVTAEAEKFLATL